METSFLMASSNCVKGALHTAGGQLLSTEILSSVPSAKYLPAR